MVKLVKQMLKKSDPRIVFFAAITLVAVIISGYMAINAITVNRQSPDYDRAPPEAFAIPVSDTIINSDRLDDPRLPDVAYQQIYDKSNKVTSAIAKQKVTPAFLRSLGMPTAEAETSIDLIDEYYSVYRGRPVDVIADSFTINSAREDYAEVSQDVNFESSSEGAPGGSFTVTTGYTTPDGATWNLSSLKATFLNE
jgi:hypothetical protein